MEKRCQFIRRVEKFEWSRKQPLSVGWTSQGFRTSSNKKQGSNA